MNEKFIESNIKSDTKAMFQKNMHKQIANIPNPRKLGLNSSKKKQQDSNRVTTRTVNLNLDSQNSSEVLNSKGKSQVQSCTNKSKKDLKSINKQF